MFVAAVSSVIFYRFLNWICLFVEYFGLQHSAPWFGLIQVFVCVCLFEGNGFIIILLFLFSEKIIWLLTTFSPQVATDLLIFIISTGMSFILELEVFIFIYLNYLIYQSGHLLANFHINVILTCQGDVVSLFWNVLFLMFLKKEMNKRRTALKTLSTAFQHKTIKKKK